ncbi:MAG: SRPBCC family protein, partial [Hyphomonadaceae bacterium]
MDLKITTPSDTEIVVTRSFAAPRQFVFDCHTRADLIPRWMGGPDGWTMSECSADARPGGRYRYVWRHEDGRSMGAGGTYHDIVSPERIVHDEMFDEDWTGGETINTISLTEHDNRTHLSHHMLFKSKTGRDAALSSGVNASMEPI